ncbi:MAG: SDR family oxidoreductase [Aliiglaciecola sp.]
MKKQLENKTVLVIGGSSGIGLSIAQEAIEQGGSVIIAGRSSSKLDDAKAQLGNTVTTKTVDINSQQSIQNLFADISHIDHLAITGPAPNFGAFQDLDPSTVKQEFEGKFWGQYIATQQALKVMSDGGSITLMSGAYSQRPVQGATSLAAVQAGIEGLVRGLAAEIPTVRFNAVSPGLTDTPLIRGIFGDQGTEDLISQTAASLPGKYVAKPEDIAQVYLLLMTNPAFTGTTLFPDSGYTLR